MPAALSNCAKSSAKKIPVHVCSIVLMHVCAYVHTRMHLRIYAHIVTFFVLLRRTECVFHADPLTGAQLAARKPVG